LKRIALKKVLGRCISLPI